jgi:hypothetical protein
MSKGHSLEQFSGTVDPPYARCDSTLLELRSCYREMPGTILTLAQACRLTGAGESRVKAALNALMEEGFLRQIALERYARAE